MDGQYRHLAMIQTNITSSTHLVLGHQPQLPITPPHQYLNQHLEQNGSSADSKVDRQAKPSDSLLLQVVVIYQFLQSE